IARIGQRFLVAGHGGVEHHFARRCHRRIACTECQTRENGSIFKCETSDATIRLVGCHQRSLYAMCVKLPARTHEFMHLGRLAQTLRTAPARASVLAIGHGDTLSLCVSLSCNSTSSGKTSPPITRSSNACSMRLASSPARLCCCLNSATPASA